MWVHLKKGLGAGQKLRLRALTLTDDPGSRPAPHGGSQPSIRPHALFRPLWIPGMHMMHTYVDKTFIHIKIKTYSLSICLMFEKNGEEAELGVDCEAAATFVHFTSFSLKF